MSTALDVDIEALVGEMDAVPCESAGHGTHRFHEGHATHYFQVACSTCPYVVVKAYCQSFTDAILNDAINPYCATCVTQLTSFKPLGPVGGKP